MEGKALSEESVGEELESEIERGESESSTQPLGIGRCIPGFLVPTVEALILHRKVREDGTSDVTLLVALFKKKGVWVKATTCVRNSTKLSKRTIQKYRYPLPWARKLALEAVRNQADSEWVRTTLEDINMCIREAQSSNEVDLGGEHKRFVNERKKSSSSLDSVLIRDKEERNMTPCRKSERIADLRNMNAESKEEAKGQRRKFRSLKRKPKATHKSIWGNSPRSRRAAYKAIRSSSSDSQGSSDLGRNGNYEVGNSEEDEEDGLVYCPFTSRDVRRYIDVKESIKGKCTERRFIRQALHNLYRHHTSLQTFVDSIRARAVHNHSQPFSTDLVWLEHHAAYIDCLLFESLKGMWGLWNEPILDLLMMSFLELTVRCTPRRQYPDKLEERVRKWMKKNQIGISSSYGPLPYFLQNAKLSERGVVVNSQPLHYGRGRPSFGTRPEFRPRSTAGTAPGGRRGGSKPDGKSGPNE